MVSTQPSSSNVSRVTNSSSKHLGTDTTKLVNVKLPLRAMNKVTIAQFYQFTVRDSLGGTFTNSLLSSTCQLLSKKCYLLTSTKSKRRPQEEFMQPADELHLSLIQKFKPFSLIQKFKPLSLLQNITHSHSYRCDLTLIPTCLSRPHLSKFLLNEAGSYGTPTIYETLFADTYFVS